MDRIKGAILWELYQESLTWILIIGRVHAINREKPECQDEGTDYLRLDDDDKLKVCKPNTK